MMFNLIAFLIAGCVGFMVGRFSSRADDIQTQIDIEQLRREAAGLRRLGDEHTETAPVLDGCYNLREKAK